MSGVRKYRCKPGVGSDEIGDRSFEVGLGMDKERHGRDHR
jgi:hypothetical protein